MDEVRVPRAEPEFSRPIQIAELAAGAVTLEVEAGPEELRALAGRLSLRLLKRLAATAEFERLGDGDRVRARVNFVADVIQSCVVTLDPVPAHIEESFGLVFAPEAEIPAERGEVEVDLEGEEPPEPLCEGRFDLGEAVAEHLALALDPYPRKSGASVGEDFGGSERERDDEDENPFAMLKELTEKG